MKTKYCWRCQSEVPFLDEIEYQKINQVYADCMRSVKDHRTENAETLDNTPLEELFQPVREAYAQLTGCHNMNHNAIMHHRLSILGQDCKGCGKPLRSPKAKLCPECGWQSEA